MPTDGVWTYAVVAGDAAEPDLAGLHGVSGEPVRTVANAGLTAVVGTVGLDEFGEEGLRRNLENLDWLAATARAHDAVISALARSGPVVPMRMATVYLDDERVRQLLAARRADFRAALERVTGRVEMGVKAYADPRGLKGQQNADVAAGEKMSGTAYLMRRRRALADDDDAFRLAAGHADRIHALLLQHAVDGKRKPAGDQRLSGRKDWTVLNGTYLVDTTTIDQFTATVAAVGADTPGIELETTGPWPPYSFAGDVVA
ncbi:Gas vesicle synthesis protein GvpL/GvpF [Mycolicibacterium chubuense NBB4]|uniref:Gas vesicle synthesis protein GvpL/GvpF n=1 Tax=Mycolicibacterium chubuense (strain NBB4) TaxID=710421 RepID=I4BE40_MYCCN|nr:GvpL/GvpF family gas vesicle protein [Mycolicibacterium chubuense]AFM15547.1 Gas vesicle synthesis protein GvpL/GvpF [Mycolicibacterium chubuense NBB4]